MKTRQQGCPARYPECSLDLLGGSSPCRLGVRAPSRVGVPVHDVLFILLILAVFGLLALCAKGAEKL